MYATFRLDFIKLHSEHDEFPLLVVVIVVGFEHLTREEGLQVLDLEMPGLGKEIKTRKLLTTAAIRECKARHKIILRISSSLLTHALTSNAGFYHV